MTLNAQDFSMHRGDTRTVTFAITDDAGLPKTLTTATLKWKAFQGGVEKITVTPSPVSVNGTDDGARVVLTPAKTSSLTPGIYQHELEITEAGGAVTTAARGTMVLEEDLITS